MVASLKLDFLKELNWPGIVDIGTGLLKIGNSSMTVYQQLFQNKDCVARAETVIVQVDDRSGRGTPLTPAARQMLEKWLISTPDK